MPSKRRREQWKSARAASLEVFKKRRLEASLLPNSAQLKIDDRKLSTADMVGETLNRTSSTPDLKVMGPHHNHF